MNPEAKVIRVGLTSKLGKAISIALVCLAIPLTSEAVVLDVHCDQPNSKLPTINSALKLLAPLASVGVNTINVTGACVENVVISAFDRLTLNSQAGASISDASGGTRTTVTVVDSLSVTFNNFTMNGGGNNPQRGTPAVYCRRSKCSLNSDVVQNASLGVAAYEGASVVISGSVVQNNNWGLGLFSGSQGLADTAVIKNNAAAGVLLLGGASLRVGNGQTVNIENNTGTGITMLTNSSLICGGICNISGNAQFGILILEGASAYFGGGFGQYSITNNGFAGVYLTELASANFDVGGTVTGNASGTDVDCGPQFTTARGATTNIGGGTTNCVEPQP